MYKAIALLAAIAGLNLLVGCTAEGEVKTTQNRGDVRARTNPDAAFMIDAAHASADEIEMSRVAIERGVDPQVKQFAQTMIQDHTTASQQLMDLARQMNMDLPMRPDNAHARMLDQLRQLSGPQFDQQYMSGMVADHERVLSQFEGEAQHAQNQQLRTWVQSQIPILRSHLTMARDISRRVGGGGEAAPIMPHDAGR